MMMIMTMPENGRLAAHVLLDTVSAWDDDLAEAGREDVNVAAMNLAFQRMNEVEAVTATFDDETDQVTIEMSDLLGGAVVTMNYLVQAVAAATGLSTVEVISRTREFVDADHS